MLLNLNGTTKEIPVSDMLGVKYQNDILDGLYIDMGDNYVFLSAHSELHKKMIATILKKEPELTGCDMSEGEVDLAEHPHLFVVNGLGRLIVREAEKLCKDAVED